MEHIIHLRHLAGVEVFYVRDVFKILHVVEPVVRAGGPCVSKRAVEHHMSDRGFRTVGNPTGSPVRAGGFQEIGRTCTRAAQVVVVECQRCGR